MAQALIELRKALPLYRFINYLHLLGVYLARFQRAVGGELTLTSRQGLCISLLFEEEQFVKAYA